MYTVRVQHWFGGMQDESKSGGGIWDNRNFNGRMQDNYAVNLTTMQLINLIGTYTADVLSPSREHFVCTLKACGYSYQVHKYYINIMIII